VGLELAVAQVDRVDIGDAAAALGEARELVAERVGPRLVGAFAFEGFDLLLELRELVAVGAPCCAACG
jgi:hypothetical protein